MLTARLPEDILAALNDVSQAERLNRSETLRFILRDWLTGHGYLRHREDPEGAN